MSKPAKRRSPLRVIVPLALAAALAALGYIGYQSMTAETAAEADPAISNPAADVASDVASDSPLVAPINDATAVVEQINDNAIEAEVLAEMDLDAAGNIIDVQLLDTTQPPDLTVVLPSFSPAALTVSTTEPDGSGQYIYDDAALASTSEPERALWLTLWGLDSVPPPAGEITIEVVMLSGQVQLVTIDAPDSAGFVSVSFDVAVPENGDS